MIIEFDFDCNFYFDKRRNLLLFNSYSMYLLRWKKKKSIQKRFCPQNVASWRSKSHIPSNLFQSSWKKNSWKCYFSALIISHSITNKTWLSSHKITNTSLRRKLRLYFQAWSWWINFRTKFFELLKIQSFVSFLIPYTSNFMKNLIGENVGRFVSLKYVKF